ncbi:DMT family transporter [Ornithinibacillus sp. 4-3]|uniref:DMT family transporter n=1 Tax=Ornithinibacillus sp. 4-3 TaxID=3231488 RepID=A0AB39HNJ6_9BACI
MAKNARWLGIILVLIGAIFWGIAATVSQRLFDEGITVGWLVAVRLISSGLLMLIIVLLSKKRHLVFLPWKNGRDAISLLIFSYLGMVAVQYTFMISIDHGNAAVATLMQYQAPIFVILYYILRKVAQLTMRDVIAVTLSLAGTFFVLTNGSFSELVVPLPSVVWGLISGVALAFYTIYASLLIRKWGSLVVIGWSMMIGGLSVAFFHPIRDVDTSAWTSSTVIMLIFVVFFGTFVAFYFFVESLQYLQPSETTLLGTVEPLAAVLTTILWLQIPYGTYQIIGTVLIIGMIVFLSLFQEKKTVVPTRLIKIKNT